MSNDNNQTNEIPWHCYRQSQSDDELPQNLRTESFVDRYGRTIEFSEIMPLEKFHEYVLASQIGERLLTGRRVLDFDNLSIRVRIKNLCDKMSVNGLEQAVYERNKEQPLAHLFIRAYTEFQYQTNPISLITARNLRFYERRSDHWYGACRMSDKEFHVHHILPKCEFEEYETDLRNLVKIPKPVHHLLHEVYEGINNGEEPGEAFRDRWLGAIPYEAESEHDLYLPEGFFEGICHDWFNKRTEVKIIRQKIADEIMICMDGDTQDELNLVMRWEWDKTGRLMGKNYTIRDRNVCLPWWWNQDFAMIANMCAYIYADHLHRRLA